MLRLGIVEILAIAAIVGVLVMAVNRNGRAAASVLLGGLGLCVLVGLGLLAVYFLATPTATLTYDEQEEAYFVQDDVRATEQALERFTSVTLPAPVAEIDGDVPEIIAGAAPREAAQPARAEAVPAQTRSQGPQWFPDPEWVGQASGLQGDVYRHIGYVGPYETAAECDIAEPVEIERAVRHYAEEFLPVRFGRQDFDEELAYASLRGIAPTVTRYDETIDSPAVGPMIQRHLRVDFDRNVQRQIVDAYRQAVVARRLTFTGIYSGLALACLGAMFGYLRLDTATRGYYSGRLKAATGAVIVAAVAAGAAVWQRL